MKTNTRKGPRCNLTRGELRDATTASLLLHGLSHGSEDPVEGVLGALRSDVEALADMGALAQRPGPLVDSLYMVVRRLDVALVLLARKAGKSPPSGI